jgi:hypothetical protein
LFAPARPRATPVQTRAAQCAQKSWTLQRAGRTRVFTIRSFGFRSVTRSPSANSATVSSQSK